VAVRVDPFKGPAVRVALPSLRAMTGKSAVAEPAGIVRLAGTSTLGSLLVRRTTVGSDWVGAMVRVRVPTFPLARLRVRGVRPLTVGGS
jgi:hypothetical protein